MEEESMPDFSIEPWQTARDIMIEEGSQAELYVIRLAEGLEHEGNIEDAYHLSEVLDAIVRLRRILKSHIFTNGLHSCDQVFVELGNKDNCSHGRCDYLGRLRIVLVDGADYDVPLSRATWRDLLNNAAGLNAA